MIRPLTTGGLALIAGCAAGEQDAPPDPADFSTSLLATLDDNYFEVRLRIDDAEWTGFANEISRGVHHSMDSTSCEPWARVDVGLRGTYQVSTALFSGMFAADDATWLGPLHADRPSFEVYQFNLSAQDSSAVVFPEQVSVHAISGNGLHLTSTLGTWCTIEHDDMPPVLLNCQPYQDLVFESMATVGEVHEEDRCYDSETPSAEAPHYCLGGERVACPE